MMYKDILNKSCCGGERGLNFLFANSLPITTSSDSKNRVPQMNISIVRQIIRSIILKIPFPGSLVSLWLK